MSETCDWILDDDDFASWASSCGEEFVIIEGTPQENGMNFCCYCGKPLKHKLAICSQTNEKDQQNQR